METDSASRDARASTVKRWLERGIRIVLPIAAAALGLAEHRALATGDFYEQPLQTLPDYLKLDQLPAKSFQQIADEKRKPPAEVAKIHFKAELEALTQVTGAEALRSIDKMIVAARVEHSSLYANEYAKALLNLLNDLRDLFAGPAQSLESIAYLKWRLNHAGDFGVTWERPRTSQRETDGAAPAPGKDSDKEIEEELAKASPALKPHWLYLQGASLFLEHQVAESQKYFLQVVKDFPKHPRAEFALFMAARCQLWRARSQEYTQQEMKLVAAERPKAKKLFEEFLAKYPHGRLYGDALGWYGAFAYDGHDFGTALRCYVQQAGIADHPELYASACEMVEKTLSHLASEPRDKAFAEVAKNPEGAQALVYLIINTSEADNWDGKLDSIDQVRGWKKNMLPRLGAAIAAEAKLYQNAEWKPRYLAMLAYASSGAGQQEQALKLLGTAGEAAGQSDDLLFARGVVFHRAKKPAEAIISLRTLLDKFPNSPLAKGARLRLGLALADNHQGGEAVLALGKLIPKPKPAANNADTSGDKKPDAPADEKKPDAAENPPAAEDDESEEDSGQEPLLYPVVVDQVRALIDTLLNFAPIEELAATAHAPGLDPVLRLQLTEPIAQRLLAKEQFDEARKFMTPAQFELTVASIAKLTQAAAEAKDPAARAAASLKLGDAWAAYRGKLLTFPLDTDETRLATYISFSADADVRRADSAPFIGATGSFRLDLENRDELKHAFKWWLDASDAQPGTPQTAQALWRALKAMPQIADVSPFTYERVLSRKWGDTAKKLYDRLRSECPDSPEAKRFAVAWEFPALPKKKADEDYPIHRPAAGDFIPGSEALKVEREMIAGYPDAGALTKDLAALEMSGGDSNLETLKDRTRKLQGRARKTFDGAFDARWVNLIDDLALFFSEPDPGEEVRKRYLDLRFRFVNKSAIGGGSFMDEQDKADPDKELQEEIKTALADSKTKPVADYFEFLNLAVIANHFVYVNLDWKDKNGDPDTYRSRDYPKLAKAVRAFLEKYPKSKKREAAMLLESRALYRASEEIVMRKPVTWPQAQRWEGGYEVTYTRQDPFDAKRVSAGLDAYDAAFPKGRYAADIRAYRAAVAMRLHDWKSALTLTSAQLADHADPALDVETANRIGEIFAQIEDERHRADILSAVKSVPAAKKLLEQYLDYEPEGYEAKIHPLKYMKSWVRSEISAPGHE